MQPVVSSGVHAIADADVLEAQYIQATNETPSVPLQPLLYIQAIGRTELALQASMRACRAPSDTLKDAVPMLCRENRAAQMTRLNNLGKRDKCGSLVCNPKP